MIPKMEGLPEPFVSSIHKQTSSPVIYTLYKIFSMDPTLNKDMSKKEEKKFDTIMERFDENIYLDPPKIILAKTLITTATTTTTTIITKRKKSYKNDNDSKIEDCQLKDKTNENDEISIKHKDKSLKVEIK